MVAIKKGICIRQVVVLKGNGNVWQGCVVEHGDSRPTFPLPLPVAPSSSRM